MGPVSSQSNEILMASKPGQNKHFFFMNYVLTPVTFLTKIFLKEASIFLSGLVLPFYLYAEMYSLSKTGI